MFYLRKLCAVSELVPSKWVGEVYTITHIKVEHCTLKSVDGRDKSVSTLSSFYPSIQII